MPLKTSGRDGFCCRASSLIGEGTAVRGFESVLARISTFGDVIARGTPSQQKDALAAMFERIEFDQAGRVSHLAPREWAKPLFNFLPNENPAC
jgi:hypothetical protein